MRELDFSPFYRSAIGFDRMANLLDSVTRSDQSQPSYPPYNIEVIGENKYRITMAVAGFKQAELSIETKQNHLVITSKKTDSSEKHQFLHQGIAARNFERRFQLADYVRVDSANLEDGLLHIDLIKEIPEAMKPRRIPINSRAEKNT